MRALLVEDSRAQRCVVRAMLKELGFEVVEATNGHDALRALEQSERPDVAVVDWNMPEMDGLEFIRELRRRRQFDSVRVVMATSETETSQIECALSAGADEYVMKPYPKDALRDKLVLLGVM
ncbi:MAG: response regulator [Planctomycetota bacterium]|nr:MAG: response regulator [Planctomycetota bacterium]